MFTAMMREGYDYGAIVIAHGRRRPDDRSVDEWLAAMVRAMGTASRESGLPGAVVCVNPESMPDEMRQMVLNEDLLPLLGLHDAFEVLGRMADYAEFRQRTALPASPLRAPKLPA